MSDELTVGDKVLLSFQFYDAANNPEPGGTDKAYVVYRCGWGDWHQLEATWDPILTHKASVEIDGADAPTTKGLWSAGALELRWRREDSLGNPKHVPGVFAVEVAPRPEVTP